MTRDSQLSLTNMNPNENETTPVQPVAAAATGSAGSKECAMHAAISSGVYKGEIYQCRKAAVAEYPEGRAHVSYRPVCSFHAKMLKRRGVEVRPLPNVKLSDRHE